MPGLSIVVVRDGEERYQRSFGYQDLESRKPATPETLYCVGSLTKSMTALAIMILHERKQLSINDPVQNFMPITLRPMGEQIRIRHLLNHTSGVPQQARRGLVLPE
jgi:CubicO group peptidase (beta-lactamase class C family)